MLKLVMAIIERETDALSLSNVAEGEFYRVKNFVEKPDRLTAEKYISSGNFFWNSGMFMFKATAYLEELKKYRPDIYSICEQVVSSSYRDLDFIRLPEEIFKDCPAESIDFCRYGKNGSLCCLSC